MLIRRLQTLGLTQTPSSSHLWTSTIRSHTKSGRHAAAIHLYNSLLLSDSVAPTSHTFTSVLKSCAAILDHRTSVDVHREVRRRGLENDVYVRTALIDAYAKLGFVEVAHKLFEEMSHPDLVSWNAMLAGFSKGGIWVQAVSFFGKMRALGVEVNCVSVLNLFPAVCGLEEVVLCGEVHGLVVRKGWVGGVSNGLMDAYCKCSNVGLARRLFEEMVNVRDAVSWGTMISGYVRNGCYLEALKVFDDLKLMNADARVNVVSVVSAVLAATEMEDLARAIDIHAYAEFNGLARDLVVVTALITMYARCNNIKKAMELFRGIQKKDVVAWSAMISAFAQTGYPKESLSLFLEMQEMGISPNEITLVSILPACAELLVLRTGKSIHCYALKTNGELSQVMGTALLSVYAKCGCFSSANSLFNILPHKNTVTWNALINGYAQIGDAGNAIYMFLRLRSSGICPDSGTIVGILPACALSNALYLGTSIHGLIVKSGFEYDLHVKNAIVDMYAKCGRVRTAEILFDEPGYPKDIVSWNTLIAGFMHNRHAKQALFAYHRLKAEGLKPNLVTLVSMIPAAAHLTALKEGMIFHAYAISIGFVCHLVVRNSLIDMYSKCGRLDYAQEIFDEMSYKDIVTWNTMIVAYAIHGLGENAATLFSQIKQSCVQADTVSFVGVLSACRHGGLVDQGRKIFQSMRSEHHFEPKMEHYACMVDLYGRAGQLQEAWDLIQKMPMKPDASVWGALLDACRVHSDVKMGKIALEHLKGIESQNAAPYVVLSGIYSQLEMWPEAREVRKTMKTVGLSKMPGCSWLDIQRSIPAC